MLFKKAISFIKNQFNCKVRFIRLDKETSLKGTFKNFVLKKGLKPERLAPDILEQNKGAKSSKRVLITRSRSLRIKAKLLADL